MGLERRGDADPETAVPDYLRQGRKELAVRKIESTRA